MQYYCICYDRWNELYYRILTLPVAEDYDVNSKRNLSRSLAVVILDKDFQKVGESRKDCMFMSIRTMMIT